MKLLRAILTLAFLAGSTPALADANDDLANLLEHVLTSHGRNALRKESDLVATGDVSISGLKDELRDVCRVASACFRLRGIPDDDGRTGMSLLVMERAEHILGGKITEFERGKSDEDTERKLKEMRRAQEELNQELRDMHDSVLRLLDEIKNSQHHAIKH